MSPIICDNICIFATLKIRPFLLKKFSLEHIICLLAVAPIGASNFQFRSSKLNFASRFCCFCKSSYFSTADAMTDNKSFLVAEFGNFNARSSGWYVNDRSNFQGTKSDCLAAAYDLKLVIIKPTHFLDNFLLPALT